MPVPGQVIVRRAGPVIMVAGGITCINLLDETGFTFVATRVWGTVPWAFPRRLLEGATDWVDPKINMGVEHSLAASIIARHGPCNWKFQSEHPYIGIDWKSSTNVTPYHKLKAIGREMEGNVWESLAPYYPADLLDLAKSTAKELQCQTSPLQQS